MPEASSQTRFFELAGSGAQAALRTLAEQLRSGGARATLLASRDADDLFLLVAEADALPAIEPPRGCRVWTFERVEP